MEFKGFYNNRKNTTKEKRINRNIMEFKGRHLDICGPSVLFRINRNIMEFKDPRAPTPQSYALELIET